MREREEFYGISFRFDPEDDQDLITWARRVPRGQRSELCKKALRLLITGQAITDPNAEAFDRLRRVVESLARKIDQGVPVRTSDNGAREIDEQQAAERERKIRERRW
jgi:hypothetical protein